MHTYIVSKGNIELMIENKLLTEFANFFILMTWL